MTYLAPVQGHKASSSHYFHLRRNEDDFLCTVSANNLIELENLIEKLETGSLNGGVELRIADGTTRKLEGIDALKTLCQHMKGDFCRFARDLADRSSWKGSLFIQKMNELLDSICEEESTGPMTLEESHNQFKKALGALNSSPRNLHPFVVSPENSFEHERAAQRYSVCEMDA